MYFKNGSSILNMSSQEVYIRCYYVWKLVGPRKISEIDFDLLQLFFLFAKRLGKMDRLEQIILLHINHLIRNKKLNYVSEEDEDDTWHFPCKKKFQFHFYEDENAYAELKYGDIENEVQANLCRCVFAGKMETLLRIFEQTFFTCKKIVSPETSVKIPRKILNAANTPNITKFLLSSKALTRGQVVCLQHLFRIATTREFSNALPNYSQTGIQMLRDLDVPMSDLGDFMENLTSGILSSFLDYDCDITMVFYLCVMTGSLNPFFYNISNKLVVKDAYPIESFSIKDDVSNIAMSLLKNVDRVNILLYGASGSGKTEYAKALIKACGLKAVEFKNSFETETQPETSVNRLSLMLSVENKNTVFVIDEAESLLATSSNGMFDSNVRKGSVNKLFEMCQNKVIWIMNYTDVMDVSTKRRFTYSIPFEKMSGERIKEISRMRLNKFSCSKKLKTQVLKLCNSYEVTGSSIDNVFCIMKAFKGSDDKYIESSIRSIFESNSSLLYGHVKMREKIFDSYDTGVINSSVPAEDIVEMVQNSQEYYKETNSPREGVRMLFYGESGTGKTEFARYIAQKLGKHLLLKRASDIISSLVGATEKNISLTFAEAEMSDQILLFDEADSFFRDRKQAVNEWEITKVNEFLTQMEEFKGIMICTTNMKGILDKALLRRFHICAEFKALDSNGVGRLLERYFPQFDFTDNQIANLASYRTVTPGDFGILAGRIRFMRRDSVNAEYIVSELASLQSHKDACQTKAIGFRAGE